MHVCTLELLEAFSDWRCTESELRSRSCYQKGLSSCYIYPAAPGPQIHLNNETPSCLLRQCYAAVACLMSWVHFSKVQANAFYEAHCYPREFDF